MAESPVTNQSLTASRLPARYFSVVLRVIFLLERTVSVRLQADLSWRNSDETHVASWTDGRNVRGHAGLLGRPCLRAPLVRGDVFRRQDGHGRRRPGAVPVPEPALVRACRG